MIICILYIVYEIEFVCIKIKFLIQENVKNIPNVLCVSIVLKLEASCTVKLCSFKSYEVSGDKCVTTNVRAF